MLLLASSYKLAYAGIEHGVGQGTGINYKTGEGIGDRSHGSHIPATGSQSGYGSGSQSGYGSGSGTGHQGTGTGTGGTGGIASKIPGGSRGLTAFTEKY